MLTRIQLSRPCFVPVRRFSAAHGWQLGILFLVCALAASAWGLARVSAKRAAKPADGPPSLGTLLKPDGTLDLSRGFQGSLNPHGYRLEYAANGAPRFVPAAPTTAGWDTQFVNANGVQRVANVVAANGTDIYVAGGPLTTAGTTVVSNIAKWNGSTWSELGSGVDGTISAIAINGSDVYVGGQFTTAGGAPANNVAKWNGSTWSALGSGVSGNSANVFSLVVSGSDVYVGGRFTTAGGNPAASIAKWNGSAWSALGSGISGFSGTVNALAVSGSNVYAGGDFSTAGGNPAGRIARWNGSAWAALGSGISSTVQALAVSGNDLYVGGQFTTAGGIPANNIAKWNGSAWSALGSGVTANPGAAVRSIQIVGTNVYVSGFFDTAGGNPANNVAVWNGSAWAAMGNGLSSGGLTLNGIVTSLAASGTDVYAVGGITKSGSTEINRIAKWNGNTWSPIGSASNSPNNVVYALAVIGTDVYVGGEFDFAGGVAANNIAKWNGSTWSALGSGLNLAAVAMAVMGTDLYVSGYFTSAGGAPANYIARWNGSAWSPLGSGLNAGALALVVSGTNLYVGGTFSTAGGVPANRIACWNSSSWSALGSGVNGTIYSLAVSGSDLYVGGDFTTAGGVPASRVAKWNGSAWSALGSGVNNIVYASAVSGSDLYVGGLFTQAGGNTAGGLAKWNGSSWSSIGGLTGGVQCLLPVGSDLYAGGSFTTTGGNPTTNLAKWNGSAWTVLSTKTSIYDVPATFALQGTNLFVGGQFTSLGGTISHYFGRYDACPSSLTVNNTGDGADASPGNGVCETATGNGICTLRAAIEEANALTSCSPITISFSITGTINTATTLPGIVHPNLTISGPGANQLAVSAVPSDHQIFVVGTNNINLSLSGLTITGGFAGAAVNAGGIEFNSTNGQLNLTACALIGNGGNVGMSQIYSNLSGGITITDSTISGNTNGYGITMDRTPLTLTNSTVSGNAIYGIRVPAGTTPTSITLLNCTIANNGQQGIVFAAFIGGGGTITTKNSIFAGSPILQINKGPGVTIVSQGNNLCSDATLTPTAAGDLINTNPLLAPLGNYGGPTPTLALLPGSPAINAGTSSGAPSTDQRGIARGVAVDIGAFESRGFILALGSGNNQSAATNTAFASPLSVTITSSFGEPVNGGQATFTAPSSGASASVAGTPATVTGGAATTGTVTANAIVGGPYIVYALSNGAVPATGSNPAIYFSLTNTNTAPTFTPATAITRQQGSPAGAAISVGTVSDAQSAAGSLTVTQIAGGTASGINVNSITNTNGTITAVVSADCTATSGTIRFQVSDGDLTGTGDLQVNVTANTAPNLTYANASVNAGASTTNSTTAATDNGSINSFAVQSQGSYTGTISVNASGVVSISNAAPVGVHTITIRATDNCGTTTDAQFTLTVNNNAPTITASAALSRQQGSAGSTATIATVNDGETPVGNLVVTATSVPTGITITGIANTNGTISANIAAACNATVGANTVVLTVTDGNSGTATANLTVNVTANTAPTLTYANASVNAGTATTNAPTSATDNGSIASYAIQSAGTYSGTISVNNSTGVVSISNVAPIGTHTITIRATDNCGATTDASFMLTVGNNLPTITPAAALTRQQGTAGSTATIATVSDNDTPLGSLVVTATTVPAGITVTAIANANGTITANIAASCATPVGGNTVGLTVTDGNNGTATANLTVNVSANTAPNLTYPISGVALNATTTITPTTATDNGSINSYSIVTITPPLTTAPTVNASGVVSVTNAAPFGLHTITVRATDNCGTTTDATFMLNVGCGSLTVMPATLINGLTFVPYTATLSASGGSGSYTFTLASGSLPAGLSLSGNTISGTPNTAGASTFTLRATDDNGCFGEQTYTLLIGSTGLKYYPLARPVRLLDTRPGLSPNACFQPNAPIPGGTSRLQPARGTCEGLTIPANATTITGNITTVRSGGGFLTIYPSDAPQPVVANSNYQPNEVLNNAFTVGVGAQDGAVKIFVTSDTDVVVDVTGYYAPPNIGGLHFHPLPRPVRLLETRAGYSGCYAPAAPLPGGGNTLQLGTGACAGLTIPPEALALVGNATTVDPQGIGYLTLYPAGATQPLVASSNYATGQIVNGPFTVGLSLSGQFNIFTSKTTELVIDITGYYSAQASDTNGQGLLFTSLGSPLRLLDTRAGQQGCYAPGAPMTGGIVYTQQTQSPCTNLTPTARALIGNATVVGPDGLGYLTFWPGDAAQPLVATSNFTAGQVFNRHFTVGLAADGSFKRFASATTELVVDISGFFAP